MVQLGAELLAHASALTNARVSEMLSRFDYFINRARATQMSAQTLSDVDWTFLTEAYSIVHEELWPQ